MTESYSAIETVQRYYTDGTHEGAHLPFNFELMKQLRFGSTAPDVVKAANSWLDTMPPGHSTNWVVSSSRNFSWERCVYDETRRWEITTARECRREWEERRQICTTRSSSCCPGLQLLIMWEQFNSKLSDKKNSRLRVKKSEWLTSASHSTQPLKNIRDATTRARFRLCENSAERLFNGTTQPTEASRVAIKLGCH